MPRLIGENLSSTKLGDYGTRSSIIQVRRGEKDTGMTALAGLPLRRHRRKRPAPPRPGRRPYDGKDLAEDVGTMNLHKMQNVVTEGEWGRMGPVPVFPTDLSPAIHKAKLFHHRK
jgi:hypothetical protein